MNFKPRDPGATVILSSGPVGLIFAAGRRYRRMLARSEANIKGVCDDNIVQCGHEGQIFLVDNEKNRLTE